MEYFLDLNENNVVSNYIVSLIRRKDIKNRNCYLNIETEIIMAKALPLPGVCTVSYQKYIFVFKCLPFPFTLIFKYDPLELNLKHLTDNDIRYLTIPT